MEFSFRSWILKSSSFYCKDKLCMVFLETECREIIFIFVWIIFTATMIRTMVDGKSITLKLYAEKLSKSFVMKPTDMLKSNSKNKIKITFSHPWHCNEISITTNGYFLLLENVINREAPILSAYTLTHIHKLSLKLKLVLCSLCSVNQL